MDGTVSEGPYVEGRCTATGSFATRTGTLENATFVNGERALGQALRERDRRGRAVGERQA